MMKISRCLCQSLSYDKGKSTPRDPAFWEKMRDAKKKGNLTSREHIS